jgi:ATP-binding cassette subfamily B protein
MVIQNKHKKINFKHNLKEYWGFLKKHKINFIPLLFVTLITQFLLLGNKYLFKKIIDEGEKFVSDVISKEIFINILIIIGIIFISITILRGVFKWISEHLNIILDCNLMKELKIKYFNHITSLSHKFHTSQKTGSLISRISRGERAIETITDVIVFNSLPLIFNLIIVGFSLIYFSIGSAITILIIAIVFISYSYFLQKIQKKSKLIYNKTEDKEKAFINDIFTNIETIKFFGKERKIQNKFLETTDKTKSSLFKFWNYYRWFDTGQHLIIGIGAFFLIYFPIIKFLNNEITLGTLVFIYTVYGNITGPMFSFVHGMKEFYVSMADFESLFAYGKIKNEIQDKKNAEKLEIKNGEIEFKNVSFNYGKKKAFSLDSLDLKIKKGEKIALVGHSGCGKTTIIKLLYRLYDTKEGDVFIDGKNLKNLKQESLRSELSIVPQECILFDDTIYNNIKFSNPNASAKEIKKAIKYSQLDKFIDNLEEKENVIVGERGIKLSGGEKQRISIARAILANKKILVLDEATSALDSQTEYLIQKALENLMKNKTSILIAHRLSTIMNADRIIVMKNGKIIQQGKHLDLISQKGEYKKLWNLQKGGYIK